jgi:hypothetical protein
MPKPRATAVLHGSPAVITNQLHTCWRSGGMTDVLILPFTDAASTTTEACGCRTARVGS